MEYIHHKHFSDYELEEFEAIAGRRLEEGETSDSGLYCIMSSKSDRILRVTPSKEIANLLCDFKSRYLAVGYLK